MAVIKHRSSDTDNPFGIFTAIAIITANDNALIPGVVSLKNLFSLFFAFFQKGY
jgi:hypothetical protein